MRQTRPAEPRLDLDRPGGVWAILAACVGLYRLHFALFATIALAVVVPIDVAVYLTGGLTAPLDWSDEPSTVGLIVDLASSILVVPLISAGHTAAVADLGRGVSTTAGQALRSARSHLWPVVIAATVWGFGSTLGLVFLIVPGVLMYVRWYVAAPAVVVEGQSGNGGLIRSAALVQGSWWHTFRIALAVGLISLVPLWGVTTGLAEVADEAGTDLILLLGRIVSDAIAYSFCALAATLTYFNLRARKASHSALV